MTHLATFLATSGVTQTAAADAIGVSKSFMSELASGAKQPSMRVARAIAQFTDGAVPVSAWGDEDAHHAKAS